MPAILDKIADKLHLHHHDNKEGGDAPKEPSSSTDAAATTATATTTTTTATGTVFDKSKVTVLFVLGGPGAGKGTQCERLVQDFDFCHLSAGDLLREEQNRPGSQYGELIRTNIREGTIVPMEVTIKLLENAMRDALSGVSTHPTRSTHAGWADGKGRFLIDGFPRKMDQAQKFEETVCESSLVLFYSTTEEIMVERIMHRAKTSGREDDNAESAKKRFVTYKNETMPVIEWFQEKGKVAELDSSVSIDEVHQKTRAVVNKLFDGVTPGHIKQ